LLGQRGPVVGHGVLGVEDDDLVAVSELSQTFGGPQAGESGTDDDYPGHVSIAFSSAPLSCIARIGHARAADQICSLRLRSGCRLYCSRPSSRSWKISGASVWQRP